MILFTANYHRIFNLTLFYVVTSTYINATNITIITSINRTISTCLDSINSTMLFYSEYYFKIQLLSVDPIHRSDNLSDHEPIAMKLRLYNNQIKIYCDKNAWHKADDHHIIITEYKSIVRATLQQVKNSCKAIAH